jgi:hypothetical protein
MSDETRHPARAVPIEPAPQPPADAATNEGWPCVPAHQSANPSTNPPYTAAPPVSGDGDEAVVRGRMPWPRPACDMNSPCGGCFTRGICDQLMWDSGYAAGLERGRALGARDERDACEAIARMLPQTPRVKVARAIADAIARRSGGQGK